MNSEKYTSLIDHEYWANNKIADVLLGMEIIPERAKRIFDHIIGAQHNWIARIHYQSPEMEIWPLLMPEDWKYLLNRNRDSFIDLINEPGKLDEEIAYKNSEGKEFTNRIDDLTLHLTLHSQYHRGQVIAYAREEIKTPPVTDFISFIRQ